MKHMNKLFLLILLTILFSGCWDSSINPTSYEVNTKWVLVANTKTTQNLNSIAWNGSRFVATTSNGTIIYSSDGQNWNIANSGTTQPLWRVAWSGKGTEKKFIAVGASNGTAAATIYSYDGVTWQSGTNSFGDQGAEAGVAWSDTKAIYVTAGGAGKIAYSSDGKTWTNATLPAGLATGVFRGVAWGKDKFVVVNYDGIMGYSYDGVNWQKLDFSTANPYPLYNNIILNIFWIEDKFIAIGEGNKIGVSSDGLNWSSKVVTPFLNSTEAINGFAYGNNMYVAVGTKGKIAYSYDLDTWVAEPNSPFVKSSGWITQIIWAGDRFIATSFNNTSGGQMAFTTTEIVSK